MRGQAAAIGAAGATINVGSPLMAMTEANEAIERDLLRSRRFEQMGVTEKKDEIEFAKETKLATLDALTISNELFGARSIPIVNTPMLGALVKVTGYLKLESLFEPIMKAWPGSRGEKNIEAVKIGYEQVAL